MRSLSGKWKGMRFMLIRIYNAWFTVQYSTAFINIYKLCATRKDLKL